MRRCSARSASSVCRHPRAHSRARQNRAAVAYACAAGLWASSSCRLIAQTRHRPGHETRYGYIAIVLRRRRLRYGRRPACSVGPAGHCAPRSWRLPGDDRGDTRTSSASTRLTRRRRGPTVRSLITSAAAQIAHYPLQELAPGPVPSLTPPDLTESTTSAASERTRAARSHHARGSC